MNRLQKKISACFFMVMLALSITGCKEKTAETGNITKEKSAQEAETVKEPLRLWYTDSEMEPFLEEAVSRFEKSENIEVMIKLVSSVEYIEAVNEASMSEEKRPDIYIAESDLLEKAELAGLVLENENKEGLYTEEYYPSTALLACEYKDKLYGYPLTFDTSFLLYNTKYVSSPPSTFDEILVFADNFEPAEGVENIINWDITNVFYNYFFAGKYLELGGSAGDDRTVLNIDNQQVKDCLTYFQDLNQFFSIDTKVVTYDMVIQEFLEEKTIFTIGKTDAVTKIEEAKSEGSSNLEYGAAVLPDLTETMETKGLSVTDLVLVNGYTARKEEAGKLAQFLTFDEAALLYEKTGKIPARRGTTGMTEPAQAVFEQYEDSVEVPKLMEAGNYWVKMEIAFSNIWAGNDVSAEIKEVSEFMKEQLAE